MNRITCAVTAALFISGMLPFLTCSKERSVPEPVIRPVRYMPVYATGGTRVRKFSGVSRAGMESKLSFKVAGTIERLDAKVGEVVTAGQLIASLDSRDYELQVQKSEATLKQAEAEARSARSNYERVRALYENNNISLNDLDAARAAHESSEALVAAARKQLELAQSQLNYCRLFAPTPGAIADVRVEMNENVDAGETVALLVSDSDIEVQVGVPEVLISLVREGAVVTVSFDAIPGRTYQGRVSEVGVASTGVVTTFPVTIILDRTDGDIRSGMAAEVAFRFESADRRERFMVPPVAVGEDRQGRFVFVVEPTTGELGIVHRRTVSVGDLTSDGLEVLDGLSEGDLLVTAGVTKLVEGQPVRLPGSSGASM